MGDPARVGAGDALVTPTPVSPMRMGSYTEQHHASSGTRKANGPH